MISLSELNKFKTNIVISFHDMWYFNPTEHYFKKKFDKNSYLKNYCWKLKRKILYKKNVFFIVHNKWMFQELIKRHPKLKKKTYLVENYPIDTDTFKPRNKINLRKKYDLPLEKKIIFFSAQDITDERKGFKFFVRLIEKLSNNDNLFFLSLGKNEIKIKNYKNHKHISFISNEKSSELYSLSDIFLCTSTIDNLPLTLLEALSSGNLVISFNNGGSKNLLKNIGYVFEINKFNNLIRFLNKIENKLISEKSLLSRKFAKQYFDKRLIAQKYHSVFENIYKKN